MRLLVTGGNGYVGRALCRALLKHHHVGVIDNLRLNTMRFTPAEVNSLSWYNVDIRDSKSLHEAVLQFQPDVIVHLAAIHFIPDCENNVELAVSTNVVGTANVAAACPPGCRLVFASTAAVYQPDSAPHDETASLIGPADVYGWTKLQGEHYIKYFADKRQFPACIVRLFNVIGPGETNPHVMPEIIAQLKAGRTAISLGNLDAKRDYIHVDDVASGFTAVATRGDIKPGTVEVVNLGTSESSSVKQLLDNLQECSGIQIQILQDPTRMRASDRPFLAANISRIRQEFQWNPTIGIKQSIAEMWRDPDIPRDWIDRYQ